MFEFLMLTAFLTISLSQLLPKSSSTSFSQKTETGKQKQPQKRKIQEEQTTRPRAHRVEQRPLLNLDLFSSRNQ